MTASFLALKMLICLPSVSANQIAAYITVFSCTSKLGLREILWYNHNQSNLQKSLLNIQNWCCKWRIKINPLESNYIIFKHNYRLKSPENSKITFFDKQIPVVSKAKFLGVTLDERMTLKNHIDDVIGKAWIRLKSVKPIFYNRAMSVKTNIRIYKCLIRPILEYGSITYLTSSTSSINDLERFQTNALRLALRIPRYIPQKLVLQAADTNPLLDRIKAQNTKIIKKLLPIDTTIQNTIITNLVSSTRYNRIKSPLDILNVSNWTELDLLTEGGGGGPLG